MRSYDCLVSTDQCETKPATATLVALSIKGLEAFKQMAFGTASQGLPHVISVQIDHLDMAFAILDDSDAMTFTLG